MGSIICGVGGSEPTRRAARVARSLSSKLGLEVTQEPLLRWEWEGGAPGPAGTDDRRRGPGEDAGTVRRREPKSAESGDLRTKVSVRHVILPSTPRADAG